MNDNLKNENQEPSWEYRLTIKLILPSMTAEDSFLKQ